MTRLRQGFGPSLPVIVIAPYVVILNAVKDLSYRVYVTQAFLRNHHFIGEIPRLRSG